MDRTSRSPRRAGQQGAAPRLLRCASNNPSESNGSSVTLATQQLLSMKNIFTIQVRYFWISVHNVSKTSFLYCLIVLYDL